MKKINLLLSVFLSLQVSLFAQISLKKVTNIVKITQPATIEVPCSEYTNNVMKAWDVAIPTNGRRLKIDYSINIEEKGDSILIFAANSPLSGNFSGRLPRILLAALSGSRTGTIYSDVITNYTAHVWIIFATNEKICCDSKHPNFGFRLNISLEEDKGTSMGDITVNGTVTGNSTGGALRVESHYGYLDLGPQDRNYAHLFTDRNNFLFNKPVYLQNAQLSSEGITDLYLQTNGSNRMSILGSNGYVGIGTTTPTSPLEVNGAIKAASLSLTNSLSANGITSANGQFNSDAAKDLYLRTNATNRMTVLGSNGYVGIGTTTPTALLEISGSSNPAFVLRGNPTHLQIGVPSANGNYAPYSKRGDVVFRPLSGVDGHHGLIFNIPNITGDGKSYIKFGDDKNGGWFSLYNNKVAVINGKVGIGVENPTQALEVNGTIKATALSLSGSLTANSLTTGGDLQVGNVAASANSYGKKLYFGIPGENGDGFFISRFNLEYDKSELRVDMGNDYNDKFVVGRKFWDQPDFEPMFTVVTNGNVGIGTSNPANKLDVKGIIRATEIKVETGWADFVFNDDYRLKPLSEVNTFIKENKRLPEIPSATEVKENEGVNLGEMQVKLLQKIEELTLYLIQQENTIQELKTEIRELKEK